MSHEPQLCLVCRYRKSQPCRPDGLFDADHVAQVVLTYLEATSSRPSDRTLKLQSEWANDCLMELAFHDPEMAFRIVLLAMIELTTLGQAVALASGALETLVATHGDRFIEQIDVLARQSPRFGFLLRGVQPQGKKDSPTWQRIEQLRENAPQIRPDDPLPPVGMIDGVF